MNLPVFDTPSQPLQSFYLPVGGGHSLFAHTYGNPQGRPVVCLHGGPGGFSKPETARYFDPKEWHVILFDQRGCGKSRWPGQGTALDLPNRLVANTTPLLIEDLETLRAHLGLQQWAVYGSSWGATLALAYATQLPAMVSGLVLSNTFLPDEAYVNYFAALTGGMAQLFPENFLGLATMLGNPRPEDFAAAAVSAMLSEDAAHALAVTKAWSWYECYAMSPEPNLAELEQMFEDPTWLLPHSLLEAHYMANNWFLEEGQLLRDAPRLNHLPVHILHALNDWVCPPAMAQALHHEVPNAAFTLLPTGGHLADEAMEDARLHAVASLAEQLEPTA